MTVRTDVTFGASYGPDVLHVIGKAFDYGWAQIQHHFDGNMLRTEQAREKLAHAVLAVAQENSRDANELKNLALQVMAMNYRQLSDAHRAEA